MANDLGTHKVEDAVALDVQSMEVASTIVARAHEFTTPLSGTALRDLDRMYYVERYGGPEANATALRLVYTHPEARAFMRVLAAGRVSVSSPLLLFALLRSNSVAEVALWAYIIVALSSTREDRRVSLDVLTEVFAGGLPTAEEMQRIDFEVRWSAVDADTEATRH